MSAHKPEWLRNKVKCLAQKGYRTSEIMHLLQCETISLSTIKRILILSKQEDLITFTKQRASKYPDEIIRFIDETMKQDQQMTSTALANKIFSTFSK